LLLISLASCRFSNSRETTTTLNLAIVNEPLSLEYQKIKDGTSISLVQMFNEGLMRINSDGGIEPGLACFYTENKDDTHFIFELRKDLKWSDGTALTAYDFEYSWKKLLNPQLHHPYAYLLFIIDNAEAAKMGQVGLDKVGIKALDDHHLSIKLIKPVPYFPGIVSFSTFYPSKKSIDDQLNENPKSKIQLSCSGPFKVTSWSSNQEIVLTKNDYYWDKKNVSIEKIKVSIVPNEKEAFALYEKGKLDFIGDPFCTLPLEAIEALSKKGLLYKKLVAESNWCEINSTLPLLRNQKVRKALSLALDRASIAEEINGSFIKSSKSFLPRCLKLNNASISSQAQPAKAQQLLLEGIEEEGLEFSMFPTLHLSFTDTQINRYISKALQSQWKDYLGINVILDANKPSQYLKKLQKLDYDLGLINWAADFEDPISYLEVFKSADLSQGNHNFSGWQDQRYVHLLNEASNFKTSKTATYEQRLDQRREHLAEAEQLLLEACPVISLFDRNICWVQNPNLQGIGVSSLGWITFREAKFKESNLKTQADNKKMAEEPPSEHL
jgi:oligopeptide transport system substrate-binding protein